jgi:VanZ family protein
MGADKLVHVTMYAVLAWLSARALATPSTRGALVIFASVAAFGALDELHQRFIPGRSTDASDIVADIVGGAVGVLAFQAAHRRRESLS